MIGFGLSSLYLIRDLGRRHLSEYQTWYADDAGIGGKFEDLKAYYASLVDRGRSWGYHPEASKSILVVSEGNEARAIKSFEGYEFKICTGTRYLGGFVGEEDARNRWVDEKMMEWSNMIQQMSNLASRCPHTIYTGMKSCLQREWVLLQQVVKSDPSWYEKLEIKLKNIFLPALFDVPPPAREITKLPVRIGRMGIRSPVETAEFNYKHSRAMTAHLIQALKGETKFDYNVHNGAINVMRSSLKKSNEVEEKAILETLSSEAETKEERKLIVRGGMNGSWLTIRLISNNGTDISPQEFRDGLAVCYGYVPQDLLKFCDGCEKRTTVTHDLNCRKGGLAIHRHNEI